MLDWTPDYIGVLIAAAFAALAGYGLGVMFGIALAENKQRKYRQLLNSMRGGR